jgi:hypothetical protein
MKIIQTKNKIAFLFFVLVFLHSLQYFSYINYDKTWGGRLFKILIIMILSLLFHKKANIRKDYPSAKYVKLFIFLPILSFLTCYFDRGQSFFESFDAYFPFLVICIYFYLHAFQIKTQDIINVIIIFALIRTGLTLIQQFTYPNYLFAFRKDRYDGYGVFHALEQRSGFYRYLIADAYFLVIFSIFYAFDKFISTSKKKYLLILLIGLLGIYMDQSRQILASTIACLFCFVFFLKNAKKSVKYVVFI